MHCVCYNCLFSAVNRLAASVNSGVGISSRYLVNKTCDPVMSCVNISDTSEGNDDDVEMSDDSDSDYVPEVVVDSTSDSCGSVEFPYLTKAVEASCYSGDSGTAVVNSNIEPTKMKRKPKVQINVRGKRSRSQMRKSPISENSSNNTNVGNESQNVASPGNESSCPSTKAVPSKTNKARHQKVEKHSKMPKSSSQSNVSNETKLSPSSSNVEGLCDTTVLSEEQKACKVTGITVLACENSEDGHRVYDKRYFCLFCDKSYAKIKAHLIFKHEETVEVAEMMSKETVKSQNRYLVRLRNLGNHKHNCEVMRKGEGSIIVVYRPQAGEIALAENFVPCPNCYGYYEKSQLWRHCKKRCVWAPENVEVAGEKLVVSKGRMLLPVPEYICVRTKEILSHLRAGDPASRAVMNDMLILQFAQKLAMKHYDDDDRHEHVRCKVRELGRLLVQLKEDYDQVQSLADAIDPMFFRNVIVSVKKVAGYNEATGAFAVPSLALKLGHSLKKCATIQLSEALQTHSRDMEEKANKFIQLCEMNWSHEISTAALKTLSNKKLNKVTIMPLTSDIAKLTSHLAKLSDEAIGCLSLNGGADVKASAWLTLAEVTLAQLILFNRRRVGEVSKMRIETFRTACTGAVQNNADIAQHLSAVEIHLCSILTRVEIIGKRGNHVPVLLTAAFKTAVDLIVAHRIDGGVYESNNYVFARPGSPKHIRGADVIRKYADECGAESPETLRGTSLRKHVATLSQVLNLKKNELDLLAQFMEHDIRVHRDFYRLPCDLLQTAKVAKILVAMDSGQQHRLTGQSLDDIQLDINEGNYSLCSY